jgi:hypothetical protein
MLNALKSYVPCEMRDYFLDVIMIKTAHLKKHFDIRNDLSVK